MRFLFVCFISCFFALSALAAQQEHSPSPAAQSTISFEGIGETHHPVSTRNAEAQRFFDQGLALAYAFNHDEAARSFRRAAELDPNLAMAWWGVSLVHGPNYNLPADAERNKLAWEALRNAQRLAPKATKKERDYIAAIASRYSPDPNADSAKLGQAYKDAMCRVMNKYSDDLDAATLCAEAGMNLRPWALWNKDGTPAAGTLEIIAILEGVLKRNPRHSGANHYLIHAVEASPEPQRAMASARQLESLAPAAGHLVHMPAHIYLRTGEYAKAAEINVQAAEADRAYIAKAKPEGLYPMMYYPHNIQFEAYAHAMSGNFAGAIAAARQLEAVVGPHFKSMPMVESFTPMPMYVLTRFVKWDDILSLPEPEGNYNRTMWHYARGRAFAARSRAAEATAESMALKSAAAKIKPDEYAEQNPRSAIAQIAASVLDGYIAFAANDHSAAIRAFEAATRQQDGLKYIEPPEWYYPVRESLGQALSAAGQYAEAEKVFREDLQRNPKNGRSQFGLVLVLRKQNKDAEAEAIESEFKESWKHADSPIGRITDPRTDREPWLLIAPTSSSPLPTGLTSSA